MPFGSEWPDPAEIVDTSLGSEVFGVVGVVSVVISCLDALQVGDVVVEWITVDMVDVVSVWDLTVDGFPDLLVKPAGALGSVRLPRGVVDAVTSTSRVRVPPEPDSIEDDDVNVCHATSLSPYRSASIAIQPRPTAHTL